MIKAHNDREPPHKLWDHPVAHEVPGLDATQQTVSVFVFREIAIVGRTTSRGRGGEGGGVAEEGGLCEVPWSGVEGGGVGGGCSGR